MIKLPTITLCCVDCVQPYLALTALIESSKHIEFKSIKLFSDTKPLDMPENIEFVQIHKINSLIEYSNFLLKELNEYIDTDFIITVQADGYIHNPHSWSDDFLEWDYIGAPWQNTEHFIKPGYRVGNGGVSLRSKKLLMELQRVPTFEMHEDVVIGVAIRPHLESLGIKIAPLEVAAKFSVEKKCDDLNNNVSGAFAFHGKYTPEHIAEINKLFKAYYRNTIIKMSVSELRDWIRNKAGSSLPSYFLCNTEGNLELQQIPEEYSEFLNILRNRKIKSYLELGVGNGGSFFVNSIFLQHTASKLHCVDNIAYRDSHIKQSETKIQKKVDMLQEMFNDKDIYFHNKTTNDFFYQNTDTFDCIFIDADHSYEGVLADYKNALKFINKSGMIVLHDTGNISTGVAKLWDEIKLIHPNTIEFKHRMNSSSEYNCGIGIIYL